MPSRRFLLPALGERAKRASPRRRRKPAARRAASVDRRQATVVFMSQSS